jgi:anti-sigma regulatory factor (Ser/Thr protein kinase)
MVQCIAEWHIKARLEDARRVREEMVEVLSRSEVPNKDAFLLASAELIVNLSRYPEPKPTDIIMNLSRDEYFWWLELKDNGPSFNRFSQDILNPDTLEAAESGMGLKLLAQMFPDIRYIPACYREDAYNLI